MAGYLGPIPMLFCYFPQKLMSLGLLLKVSCWTTSIDVVHALTFLFVSDPNAERPGFAAEPATNSTADL